jgi:hypothetical protein
MGAPHFHLHFEVRHPTPRRGQGTELTTDQLFYFGSHSALKEAIDDYYRYRQDKQANEREVIVYRNGDKVPVRRPLLGSQSASSAAY